MENFKLDWLATSTAIEVGIFLSSVCVLVAYLAYARPYILLARKHRSQGTTLNWEVILGILMNCLSLASGVLVISNVLVFLLWGEQFIDAKVIALLAVPFAIRMFQSFDRFVTKLFRGSAI